jgi:uncharacterized protein (TIGR00266 family)
MEHEVTGKSSFSLLVVNLEPGEGIIAEAGAMVSMTTNVEMTTEVEGGVFDALKRKMLGESFFMNTFVAGGGKGQVTFAPPMPGDIEHVELAGMPLYLQSGSFLACALSVELDTKWGGAKNFFADERLFLLKAGGEGPVFFSGFGAIQQVELEQGQRYIIDTGHVVAFDDLVHFEVRKAGGLKSFFFSGEGLVCEFVGPGRVYLQTRNKDALHSWLSSGSSGD